MMAVAVAGAGGRMQLYADSDAYSDSIPRKFHRRRGGARFAGGEGDRDETGLQRGELDAGLEGAVPLHRRDQGRSRLHRRYHRLLLGHRGHAGLVGEYTKAEPGNAPAKFLPALRKVDGTASHRGLGQPFVAAWRTAAKDPNFQHAQAYERDQTYFGPAVAAAKQDGLGTLGQFIYYDAMVMHGPGDDPASFGGIRAAAHAKARPTSKGGNQIVYLDAFLDVRVKAMKLEEAHSDTSRVDDGRVGGR